MSNDLLAAQEANQMKSEEGETQKQTALSDTKSEINTVKFKSEINDHTTEIADVTIEESSAPVLTETDSPPINDPQSKVKAPKKTVMTLSVANLMSNPTPLRTLNTKQSGVTIKTAQQPIQVTPIKNFTPRLTASPTPLQANGHTSSFIDFPPLPPPPSLPLIPKAAPRIQNIERPNKIEHNQFNAVPQNFQSYQYNFYPQQRFQQPQYQQQYQQQFSQQVRYSTAIVQPTQPQALQRQIPQPIINPTPSKPPHGLPASDPVYYQEEGSEKYGVRCVCGDNHQKGLTLVQCEHCLFWLHGKCVNVARAASNEVFICPYCLNRKIKCTRCKKNNKFDVTLVKCTKCNTWVHKACEGIGYGITPKPFLCSGCHRGNFDIPAVTLSQGERNSIDFTVYLEINRTEIINNIPEGYFRSCIESELNTSELGFVDTMQKYFNLFCIYFFGKQPTEFWRVFTQIFSAIFGCDRDTIMTAIDMLAVRLLYQSTYVPFPDPVTEFNYSDSIAHFVEQSKVPEFDRMPRQTALSLDRQTGHVITTTALNDGDYICDLPGFLMHTDEVFSDNGIPLGCFSVYDTNLIIDMSNTPFKNPECVRRSFHYNAYAQLIRVGGLPRVALYAVRPSGPLGDELASTLPQKVAIPAGGEIVLRLDGDIPFAVTRRPWREKKQRARAAPKAKEEKAKKKKGQPKKPQQGGVQLTLLSAFLEDAVPPMPFTIISDEEAAERMRMRDKIKERSRGSRSLSGEFMLD